MDFSRKYSQNANYVIREVHNEFLMIPINNDTVELDAAYVMNESGAFIFEQCDGTNSIEDIIHKLCAEFDVPLSQAKEDVENFISEIEGKFIS